MHKVGVIPFSSLPARMKQYFPILFLGAVLFFQLNQQETSTLLSILLMCIFAGGAFYWVWMHQREVQKKEEVGKQNLQGSVEGRKEIVTPHYDVAKFGKIKHVLQNPEFLAILQDLRFVRIFDKARYADLILYMEKFQKIYMYVLAGRRSCLTSVATLTDLRDGILELLYSLVYIVPEILRHSYNIDPPKVVQRNIENFTVISRRMMEIVHSYCESQCQPRTQTIAPRPYETMQDQRLP